MKVDEVVECNRINTVDQMIGRGIKSQLLGISYKMALPVLMLILKIPQVKLETSIMNLTLNFRYGIYLAILVKMLLFT